MTPFYVPFKDVCNTRLPTETTTLNTFMKSIYMKNTLLFIKKAIVGFFNLLLDSDSFTNINVKIKIIFSQKSNS